MQCWDNSTRGLDSATALEFVKTLRLSTDLAGSAAVVAIYQASQSIYDIFDKVAVLYEGRQIYFGDIHAAKKYFLDMGFDCPPRQTTGDFLTSITSPAERVTRAGFEGKTPFTPDEFAAAWYKSDDRAKLMREIEEFDTLYPIGGASLEQFKEGRRGKNWIQGQMRMITNKKQLLNPRTNASNPRIRSQSFSKSNYASNAVSRDFRVI